MPYCITKPPKTQTTKKTPVGAFCRGLCHDVSNQALVQQCMRVRLQPFAQLLFFVWLFVSLSLHTLYRFYADFFVLLFSLYFCMGIQQPHFKFTQWVFNTAVVLTTAKWLMRFGHVPLKHPKNTISFIQSYS